MTTRILLVALFQAVGVGCAGARKEALIMFGKKRIVKPAECPVCQRVEGVRVMKATVQAGDVEEHVGWVRDCVYCGERYTALFSGSVVKQRPLAPRGLSEKQVRSSDGGGAPENALAGLPVDVNDLGLM